MTRSPLRDALRRKAAALTVLASGLILSAGLAVLASVPGASALMLLGAGAALSLLLALVAGVLSAGVSGARATGLEQDLSEQQRAVLENLLAGVIVIDERGTIETFSRQAETIFGYAAAEVIGRNISMLMVEPERAHHDGYLANYARTGERHIIGATREVIGRRKDGREVPIEIGVTEIRVDGRRKYTGMVRDLSTRRAAQAAQAASEERFRSLFEHSPEPIFVQGDGRIVMANAAALALLGAAAAGEVVGRPLADFFEGAGQVPAGAPAGDGRPATREHPVRTLHGTWRIVETVSATCASPEGPWVVTACRDVSEQRAAWAALVESEERFRSLFENSPEAIVLEGPKGILMANAAAVALLGVESAEALFGQSLRQYAAEPDGTGSRASPAEGWPEAHGVALAPRAFALRRPDGTQRVAQVVSASYRAADGLRVVTTVRDVTDLVEANASTAQSLALLEAMFEATDNGFLVTDPEGRIVRWNRRFTELFELPPAAVATLERGDRTALLAATRAAFAAPDEVEQAALQSAGDPNYRGAYTAALKSGRFVERYTQPMVRDGRPAGRIWSYRDVTARERERVAAAEREAVLERRVGECTEELEKVVADLKLFTSAISHDLRAPLRAVGGFIEMALKEGGDTLVPPTRRHLERVANAVRNMVAMVEGLLALARHSRAPINRQAVQVDVLAREVFEELSQGVANAAELRLSACPPADADPVLLRVVLQNLIGNALKYSRNRERPVVEVGSALRDGRAAWFVADNGAGFDPKYADKLFQPFGRLHSPREFEGTGVGLAAVHRILERHGGRIWADAQPGQGAKFWFTLS